VGRGAGGHPQPGPHRGRPRRARSRRTPHGLGTLGALQPATGQPGSELYALDTVLPDLGEPNKAELLEAMQGHVLGEAVLMGTYAH